MTQGPDPAPIERILARWLGDDTPRHVGSGWISGVTGVFLGATALGAVLLLRRRKAPGLTGLALTLAALVGGGAGVEIRGDIDRSIHFGLDWFLLNLLVFALVFVPLERAFPLRPGQRVLRAGWSTEIGYFFVNHVGIQLLTLLSLWPAMALAQALGMAPVSRIVSAQPVWLQVLELMVLAGFRLHLVDVVITRAPVVLPAFVLGFAEPALYAWLVVIALHGVLNHVNLRFRWLDRPFGTHHLPGDRWPGELGIRGQPVPAGFLAQLAYPLRRT